MLSECSTANGMSYESLFLPSFTHVFLLKSIVDYTIRLSFNGYLTVDVTLMFVEIVFRKEHKGLPWLRWCVPACAGESVMSYTQTFSTPIIVSPLFLSLLPASGWERTYPFVWRSRLWSSDDYLIIKFLSEEYYLLDCILSVSLSSSTYIHY